MVCAVLHSVEDASTPFGAKTGLVAKPMEPGHPTCLFTSLHCPTYALALKERKYSAYHPLDLAPNAMSFILSPQNLDSRLTPYPLSPPTPMPLISPIVRSLPQIPQLPIFPPPPPTPSAAVIDPAALVTFGPDLLADLHQDGGEMTSAEPLSRLQIAVTFGCLLSIDHVSHLPKALYPKQSMRAAKALRLIQNNVMSFDQLAGTADDRQVPQSGFMEKVQGCNELVDPQALMRLALLNDLPTFTDPAQIAGLKDLRVSEAEKMLGLARSILTEHPTYNVEIWAHSPDLYSELLVLTSVSPSTPKLQLAPRFSNYIDMKSRSLGLGVGLTNRFRAPRVPGVFTQGVPSMSPRAQLNFRILCLDTNILSDSCRNGAPFYAKDIYSAAKSLGWAVVVPAQVLSEFKNGRQDASVLLWAEKVHRGEFPNTIDMRSAIPPVTTNGSSISVQSPSVPPSSVFGDGRIRWELADMVARLGLSVEDLVVVTADRGMNVTTRAYGIGGLFMAKGNGTAWRGHKYPANVASWISFFHYAI